MSKATTEKALNRLLTTLYRSRPMYLAYAAPWTCPFDEKTPDVLRHIVEDQNALCSRVVDFLMDRHLRVDMGDYPMEFTGCHDVSLEYLAGLLVQEQKRDIATIQSCIAELQNDPEARALAEEALGAARGHLEALTELSQAANGSSPSSLATS